MGRITYVKETLAENKLKYSWLCDKLNRRGIRVTPTDLSGIFGGKAETIIEESMNILEAYVANYANG